MNIVEMRGICKFFGDFCANDHIDFDLQEGEIHGLLGENGAGKSTLMNVLYGLYTCDAGSICIDGKQVHIKNPSEAIANGIGMVHQHFALIPQMSVTQNIFLGMREAGLVLNMKHLDDEVLKINRAYGFNVDPRAIVWQLPVGVQQKVEILKILVRKARILVLDEPTAVLTPQEVTDLFASLTNLAKSGCSIILITHKIEDVLCYCDRVTVLRNGHVEGTVNAKDIDKHKLARMMVGRDVFLTRKSKPHPFGNVLLGVKELRAKNNKGLEALNDINFEICGGEVLGIAGVDGNGQLELGEALTGLRRCSGEIRVGGEKLPVFSPKSMIDKGVAHIPDDRHLKGLVMPFELKNNLILASQRTKRYSKGLFMRRKTIDKTAAELAEAFDIRPRDIDKPVSEFSGGNQQKVIVAREFSRTPDILIAIQPTRGLDVGAIEFVWDKIIEARDAGKAILLISTDLDEILSLSDTIRVMFRGRLSRELPPDVPCETLGLLMAGNEDTATSEKEACICAE